MAEVVPKMGPNVTLILCSRKGLIIYDLQTIKIQGCYMTYVGPHSNK